MRSYDDFKDLEKNSKTKIKTEDMEDGVRKRGTILYAVLTSLVQGRPPKLLKAVQPGNGLSATGSWQNKPLLS